MIQEEIEKRAYKVYPVDEDVEYDKYRNSERIDLNEKRREGYIKACEDYESLPKIRGWVARDKDGKLKLCSDIPQRLSDAEVWGYTYYHDIDSSFFPDVAWESEPVEVELLIRKV